MFCWLRDTKTYPNADIKQYVYNKYKYSFIQDEKVKKQLLKDLDLRFKTFEANFPLK
jgi:hypothetical protein